MVSMFTFSVVCYHCVSKWFSGEITFQFNFCTKVIQWIDRVFVVNYMFVKITSLVTIQQNKYEWMFRAAVRLITCRFKPHYRRLTNYSDTLIISIRGFFKQTAGLVTGIKAIAAVRCAAEMAGTIYGRPCGWAVWCGFMHDNNTTITAISVVRGFEHWPRRYITDAV